jgi:hypothetical protein
LQDAFAPVRTLVGGEAPLVPAAVYNAVKTSTARVVSSVGVVDALEPWAFFAIAGTDRGAPRWVFFDDPQGRPETDLQRIGTQLRERLADNPAPHPLDTRAAAVLQEFITRLKRTEIELLPRKKQRALQEMKRVLQQYRQQARKAGDAAREETLRVLLSLTAEHQRDRAVDLGMVADCWIGLVRPVWYRCLQQRPRGRPMLLADIRSALLSEPLDTDHLREAFKAPLWLQTVDERIVAALIGVPPAA